MAMWTEIGGIDLMSPQTLERGMELVALGGGCTLAVIFAKFGILDRLDTKAKRREAELLMENEPEGFGLDLARKTMGTVTRAKMTGGKARLWHFRGSWKALEVPRLERVEMITPVLNESTGLLEV